MTIFDQVLEVTGSKTAEENPGYRLRLNSAHLDALTAEVPGCRALRNITPDEMLRVYGYPIRLDETVTEMRLELA